MQQLQKSCQESYRYPLNLPPIYNAQYDLRSNHDLLCTISSRTFADESKAALEFWEQQRDAYIRTSITCHQSLRDHLNLADQHYEQPPLSCFVFLEARSSRTRLLITRDMLTDLLTYFQVMAGVVPMVASFGCDAARDYQHCQLESAVRLQPPGSGIAVPELNRSGRMYEIAYVFRTVERSENVPGMPWQIKQTCIYHNFDVVTGLAVWIMIKGSDCLRRRLTDELSSSPAILPTPRATERCAQAFGSTFNVQAMCADLSIENWRWYINFLEQEAQTMTRVITFKPVVPPTTTIPTPSVTKSDRSAAVGFVARARTLSLGHLSRSSTLKSLLAKMNITESTQECKVPDIPSTVSSPSQPALSFVAPQLEEETYFETLQSIKGLEERAFEARLVLKTSIRIWDQLQRTYDEVISDEHFPESLRNEGKHCFSRFRCRMRSTQDALENQVLRVDTLITLLAGRKALLHSVLEWRSMRSGNDLAIQATKSSLKMEEMTAKMQDVADRTEKETVSMRIITLVTMFFLPGTFISTLMSTDIVKFEENQKVFSPSALRLFLLVSLPMMLATFCAWYVVYWCANSREKVQRARRRVMPESQV